MEERLEIKKLIDFVAEQIDKGKIDGNKCPNLDICYEEIQCMEEVIFDYTVKQYHKKYRS